MLIIKQLYKKFFFSFFSLLAILFFTEAYFSYTNPYRLMPTAAESNRNAARRYAWSEYLNFTKKRDKKLLVFIGNSQIFGNEMKDEKDIYFSQLKEKFRQIDSTYELQNWSVSGLRTSDMELLSIMAGVKKADVVVFPIISGTIDFMHEIRLDFPNTDINLFVARSDFRKPLKNTLLYQSINREDFIKYWLTYHSATIRYRTHLYHEMAKYTPDYDEIFWFGKPMRTERNYQIAENKDFRNKYNKNPNARDLSIAFEERQKIFENFHKLLEKRLKPLGTKVIFVWIPVSTEKVSKKNVDYNRIFVAKAEKQIRQAGWTSLYFTESVPPEYFLTRGHFTKEGHQYFSQIIFDALRKELINK